MLAFVLTAAVSLATERERNIVRYRYHVQLFSWVCEKETY